MAVGFFGSSWVFPLSPRFLEEKVHALRTYFAHRPSCLFRGHGDLMPLIDEAERRHDIPPGLLASLIEVESEMRVHRISAAGAMGPGQLMPNTAKMLRVRDPFDPAEAIDGSARYLARQLRRFKRVDLALAAYNAGPGSVSDRVPRNGETEFYVPKVLRAYEARKPRSDERSAAPSARPGASSAAKPDASLSAKADRARAAKR